jgi:queuosine precursor transporter
MKKTKKEFLNVITIVYVVMMLAANVMCSKPITFLGIATDAGTLTYPLTFMIGDIVADVFGYKESRKIILWGFFANLIFVCCTFIGVLLNPLETTSLTESYDVLFSYNVRILISSFAGYIVGNLLNAASLVWIKKLTGERFLAVRTIGSTALGALLDTAIFTTLAWAGTLPVSDILAMGVGTYLIKMVYEAVFATPLDYAIVPLINKHIERN